MDLLSILRGNPLPGSKLDMCNILRWLQVAAIDASKRRQVSSGCHAQRPSFHETLLDLWELFHMILVGQWGFLP
jgi:hypothetical protein